MAEMKELVERLLHQIEINDYHTTDTLHDLKMNKAYCDLVDYFKIRKEPSMTDEEIMKTAANKYFGKRRELTPTDVHLLHYHGSCVTTHSGDAFWFHPQVSLNVFHQNEGTGDYYEVEVINIKDDRLRNNIRYCIAKHGEKLNVGNKTVTLRTRNSIK